MMDNNSFIVYLQFINFISVFISIFQKIVFWGPIWSTFQFLDVLLNEANFFLKSCSEYDSI